MVAYQKVNFSGLPEMVRTFLQVAAGAADIPVTRLLGQSPAGMSATGDSDTRNYCDMIAARQELDLRPQLERLDALLLPAAGIDPDAVRFAFRPLWQLSAAEKAQTSVVYAGLNLWPAATTAQLVRSQLVEDGVYPGAGVVFGAEAQAIPAQSPAAKPYPRWAQSSVVDYSADQPRDNLGRWSSVGGTRFSTGEVTSSITEAANSGFGVPRDRPIHVAGGKFVGETPEEEEEQAEKKELRKEREDIGLSAGFRARPDGSMEATKLPPMTSGTSPSSGAPFEIVPASKIKRPPNISEEHWSVIGPGAYAHDAITTSKSRDRGQPQREWINNEGYRFGCHSCGATDPGTDNGNFITDHQPPSGLHMSGEPRYILPHCKNCIAGQGARIRALKAREDK